MYLGRLAIEHAAAERDHAALRVANRETSARPRNMSYGGRAVALDQPDFHARLEQSALCRATAASVAGRAGANPSMKARAVSTRDAARFQIVARERPVGRVPQHVGEKFGGD